MSGARAATVATSKPDDQTRTSIVITPPEVSVSAQVAAVSPVYHDELKMSARTKAKEILTLTFTGKVTPEMRKIATIEIMDEISTGATIDETYDFIFNSINPAITKGQAQYILETSALELTSEILLRLFIQQKELTLGSFFKNFCGETMREYFTVSSLFDVLKSGMTQDKAFDYFFEDLPPSTQKNDIEDIPDDDFASFNEDKRNLLNMFRSGDKTTLGEFFQDYYQYMWVQHFDELNKYFKTLFTKRKLAPAIEEIKNQTGTLEAAYIAIVKPLCDELTPLANIENLYKNFALNQSPLGAFFANTFTPCVKKAAANCVFKAIKNGFDVEEIFEMYLDRFAKTATQTDIKNFYKKFEKRAPLKPAESCLLRAFLASSVETLGRFVDLLFNRVLKERGAECLDYFAEVVKTLIKYAVDNGAKVNDSAEDIMNIIFQATIYPGNLMHRAFQMTFLCAEESFPTTQAYLSAQIQVELSNHNAKNITVYIKNAVLHGKPIEVAYAEVLGANGFEGILTIDDVKSIPKVVLDNMPPLTTHFFEAFVAQTRHHAFEDFFNGLYYQKLAEKHARYMLHSGANCEMVYHSIFLGVSKILSREDVLTTLSMYKPGNKKDYLQAFVHSDHKTLGEFFKALYEKLQKPESQLKSAAEEKTSYRP